MEVLIPITFFICIAYAIETVVDARVRTKLVSANVSQELLRSMLLAEEQQHRQASLRWGVVLSCLAVGFALIEMFGWKDAAPGAIAVVVGATGIGNLVFYAFARKSEPQNADHGERRQV